MVTVTALVCAKRAISKSAELLVIPTIICPHACQPGCHACWLGIPRHDGGPGETDPRAPGACSPRIISFRGTPSAMWLNHSDLSAPMRFHRHRRRLLRPYRQVPWTRRLPAALFDRFDVELLATTDTATDDLGWHSQIATAAGMATSSPPIVPTPSSIRNSKVLRPIWSVLVK